MILRILELATAVCVTVEAVAIDGIRSGSVKRCEADICKAAREDRNGFDEISCGCSATAGGPASMLWVVALLAFVGAKRSRRVNGTASSAV